MMIKNVIKELDNGQEIYHIYFYNGIEARLTKKGYEQILKALSKEEQNEIIKKESAQNVHYSSDNDSMSNAGTILTIIIGCIFIYLCVKVWYYIPLFIGIITLIVGIIGISKSIDKDKKFNLLYAFLGCIFSAVVFIIIMFFLHFMSFVGHIGMSFGDVVDIHISSGFNRNADIGLILTLIGSFFIGAFIKD